MQISSQNLRASSFDFSLKTSSGDKISLSMYDKKSLEFSTASSENSKTTQLSLRHEYGYRFEYSGNGLDENDIKEIDEALKSVDKKFSQFLKSAQDGENFTKMDLTNIANSIKSALPEIKNINHKNMISDKILDIFDENLLKNRANSNILRLSNELYEKILQSFEKFSIYV